MTSEAHVSCLCSKQYTSSFNTPMRRRDIRRYHASTSSILIVLTIVGSPMACEGRRPDSPSLYANLSCCRDVLKGATMPTTSANLVLTGKVQVSTGKVQLEYAVQNKTPEDVYLLEGLPARDPQTQKPSVNPRAAYVFWVGDGIAMILQGIPPLPSDRNVAVRVVPFAVKIAAGETLRGTVELPMPLAENSPYYGPPTHRDIEEVRIETVRLGLDVLGSKAEGFGAEEVSYAPGYFRVWARATTSQAVRLTLDLSLPGITLLKRTGCFSRP